MKGWFWLFSNADVRKSGAFALLSWITLFILLPGEGVLASDDSHDCPPRQVWDYAINRCVLPGCGDGILKDSEECEYNHTTGMLMWHGDKPPKCAHPYCDMANCSFICPNGTTNANIQLPVLDGEDGLCTIGKQDLGYDCTIDNCTPVSSPAQAIAAGTVGLGVGMAITGGVLAAIIPPFGLPLALIGLGIGFLGAVLGSSEAEKMASYPDILLYVPAVESYGKKLKDSALNVYFATSGNGVFQNEDYNNTYISDSFVREFADYVLDETGYHSGVLRFYDRFGFYPWDLYDDVIFAACAARGKDNGECDDRAGPDLDFFGIMPKLVDKDGNYYYLGISSSISSAGVNMVFGPPCQSYEDCDHYSPQCVVAQRESAAALKCDMGVSGAQRVNWYFVEDLTPCGRGFECVKGKCVNASSVSCGDGYLNGAEECEYLATGGEIGWYFNISGTLDGPYEDRTNGPSCTEYNKIADTDYTWGNLSCSPACMIDTSKCKSSEDICGDGIVEADAGEECDWNATPDKMFASPPYPEDGSCHDYNPGKYADGNMLCTPECVVSFVTCQLNKEHEFDYGTDGCFNGENDDAYFDRIDPEDKESDFNATKCLNTTNCTDCQDIDCNGEEKDGHKCEFKQEISCNDGFDNDGDGLIDEDDTDDCIPGLRSYKGDIGACSITLKTNFGGKKVNPCYDGEECVPSGTIEEDFLCHNGTWYSRVSLGFAILLNKTKPNEDVKMRCEYSPTSIFNNINYFSTGGTSVSKIFSSGCVDSACYLISRNKSAILLNIKPWDFCFGSDFPSSIFADVSYDNFLKTDNTTFENLTLKDNFSLFYNDYTKQLIYSNYSSFTPLFENETSSLASLYKTLEEKNKQDYNWLKNAIFNESLVFYYMNDNGEETKLIGKKGKTRDSTNAVTAILYNSTSGLGGLMDSAEEDFSSIFWLILSEVGCFSYTSCDFYTVTSQHADLLFINGSSEKGLFNNLWPGYTTLLWKPILH